MAKKLDFKINIEFEEKIISDESVPVAYILVKYEKIGKRIYSHFSIEDGIYQHCFKVSTTVDEGKTYFMEKEDFRSLNEAVFKVKEDIKEIIRNNLVKKYGIEVE